MASRSAVGRAVLAQARRPRHAIVKKRLTPGGCAAHRRRDAAASRRVAYSRLIRRQGMNSRSQTLARTGVPGRRRQLSGGLIAGILFPAVFGLLAVVYVGFVLWPRHTSEPANAPSLPVTVAGVVFNV